MAAKAGISAAVSELSTLHEDDLRQRILARPLPRHVAVIMDGNGRWATNRGLPRVAGHGEGVKSVRAIVRTAGELGIEFLTLYAFSSENWNRPHQEVSTLMTLLERSIERELPELMERNVRFRVIGRAGRGARAGGRAHRAAHRDDLAQHRPHPAHGLQLRRPRRAGGRVPRARARGAERTAAAGGHRRGARRPARSTPTASPIRTCSSARAGSCACPTSSCGRSPTPSCG